MTNRLQLCVLALTLTFIATLQTSAQEENVTLSAYFQLKPGTNQGRLFVNAEIAEGWNMYSTTTPAGGPMRTKFTVLESDQYKIEGSFEAEEDPHLKFEEIFEMVVEEFVEKATWSAPIKLAEGVNPDTLEIDIRVKGQSCSSDSGVCTLVNAKTSATHDGELEQQELQTSYEPARGHVIWSGEAPAQAVAGQTIQIKLNAEPTEGYKIYAYAAESQNTVAQPTRIAFAKSNGWRVGSLNPSEPPTQKIDKGERQQYYKQPVSWTIELMVPETAETGSHNFQGYVAFQNCTDQVCDPPSAAMFSFDITVGGESDNQSKIGFAKSGSYSRVAQLADRKAKEADLLSEHE